MLWPITHKILRRFISPFQTTFPARIAESLKTLTFFLHYRDKVNTTLFRWPVQIYYEDTDAGGGLPRQLRRFL